MKRKVRIRMGKWVDDIVKTDYNFEFYSCKSVKDLFEYSKIVWRGFKMSFIKSIIYFFTAFYNGYENYIIKKDNEIIGCFSLYYDMFYDEEICKDQVYVTLYDFCILDKYKGKGLGRYYLECILQKIKEGNTDFIDLDVDENNVIAISLYKSLDFFEIKEEN